MLILYLEGRQEKITEVEQRLTSMGYRAHTCSTITAGLQLLEEYSFDMVVSGVHKQSKTPLGLIELIRESPKFRKLPIVFLDSHQTPFFKRANNSQEITCGTPGVTHFVITSTTFEPNTALHCGSNLSGVRLHTPPKTVPASQGESRGLV